MSKKNLLEDGTVLTLGLVGAVAAVGALASRRGSRAMVSEGIYKDISLPADELGAGHHGSKMLTVDVNTQDEDWGKPWLVTVGSGYSGHHFLVFGSSEDSALAHAIETAVVTAPGWTARPGDEHLEEMLREYDGEGYATDDGSVYLGHFDSLHIRRLDNNVRSLLQRHGVSLEGEGSSNRGSRSTGPTDAELRAVGRYTKSVNPDEKKYAREAGHGTGDLAIGKYVYSHYDEDSFAELLDHVREQGLVKGGSRATTRSSTDFHATISNPTGQVLREQRLDHPFFSGSHDTYENKVLDMALEMVARAPVGSIITIRGDGRSWRFKVVKMSGGHLGVRKMRDRARGSRATAMVGDRFESPRMHMGTKAMNGSRAKAAMHPFGWAQVKGGRVVKLSDAQRKPVGAGWGAVNTSNTRIGSQAYLEDGTVYLR